MKSISVTSLKHSRLPLQVRINAFPFLVDKSSSGDEVFDVFVFGSCSQPIHARGFMIN